jgi:hypothetical protein
MLVVALTMLWAFVFQAAAELFGGNLAGATGGADAVGRMYGPARSFERSIHRWFLVFCRGVAVTCPSQKV